MHNRTSLFTFVKEAVNIGFVVGYDGWGSYVQLVRPDHHACLGHDDQIIEAGWDVEQQGWRFMRIRNDKAHANHINVVESIIKPIVEPVHQKDVRALP
jgi:hypothetical protein